MLNLADHRNCQCAGRNCLAMQVRLSQLQILWTAWGAAACHVPPCGARLIRWRSLLKLAMLVEAKELLHRWRFD